MEEFKEKEKKSLVENIRSELLDEKNRQLKNKAENKNYNKDYEDFDVNSIGVEEAQLWQKMKEVKDKDGYKKMVENFEFYRKRIIDEIDEEAKMGKSNQIKILKKHFIYILGNRINQLQMNFLDL